MAEDGKIVYRVVIDSSGAVVEAENAGRRVGTQFANGAGTVENVWTGAARRIGEAFVNMAANAARQAGRLLTGAIETGMNFDAAMSQVAATLGYTVDQLHDAESEEAQNLSALRDFALEMGRTTVFTATEAADALNYMALAGYDAETSMRMLPTVLNLAAAGSMDLARASDVVTDIQSALGLTIEETEAMVDQMARTAQRTNTNVAQLGEAMLTIGPTAKNMAGGTAEITEVLGLLASNGVKGAEAGTHLRNMLLSLASPTETGAAALEQLGIRIFDADGNMRSFLEIMPEISRALNGAGGAVEEMMRAANVGTLEDLQAVLDTMSDDELDVFFNGLSQMDQLGFLDTVFNKRDIASALALINTSADEWARLQNEILGSRGAAGQMAETQLDNLKGDVTLLKSAWEGFQVELAAKFEPILREIMPQLIALVGRLTESLQNADWSHVGDQILNIAEKLITFLEWVINHGDEVLKIVEGAAAALLGGKAISAGKTAWTGVQNIASALGLGGGGAGAATGAAATTGAEAAAAAAAPEVTAAAAEVGTAAGTAFWDSWLSAVPLVGLAAAVTAVMTEIGAQAEEEMRAAGRIEGGTVEDYRTRYAQLNADYEAAVAALDEMNANFSADDDINALNEAALAVTQLAYARDEALSQLQAAEAELAAGTLQALEPPENAAELQAGWDEIAAGLSDDAQVWGEDMMASFADGISAGADSALWPAVIGVAAGIASLLAHSEPEVGPLSNDSTWMPDMMQGFARQIEAYTPLMTAALDSALGDVPTRFDYERAVSVNIAASGRVGSGVIEVPVVLNGREIARASAWDMGEQLAWEEL